ncbi:RNA methyltransferase [Acidovorax sp. Root219]|uniref:RNA methyltransferase n=1 Tax=Acidovorax sp. Root219 TaxID=1736493 RepID=UPI000710441A|nr:RNA methyltransferase [Acidovorax sp. Root219]KRC30831.1 rRNA methyltransferase [Acidovorax sp. Root219]
MKTRFVLINTSHAGNVGAAARALKTMGFDDLVLVEPRWANVLRREETIQRASGALDVLQNARIVATLDEALDGMSHLCATAMTPRDFGPPTRSPREHFAQLVAPRAADAAVESGVAFLFGSERFGMANEDVYRCHVALSIPTNPGFGSLNLGAAVQVIAYEWRMALGGFGAPAAVAPAPDREVADAAQERELADAVPARELADAAQVAGMLAHWERALVDIGFLDPDAPKKLMPRLNQLFNRAQLGSEEIHILRGVAKAMIETAQAKR